jgi:MFS family permease
MNSNLAFASVSLLLNSTVDTPQRATVNGLNMTAGSLAKTIGPTIGTFIFAWTANSTLVYPLDFHFIFIIMAFIGIISVFISTNINESRINNIDYIPVKNTEISNNHIIKQENIQPVNVQYLQNNNNNEVSYGKYFNDIYVSNVKTNEMYSIPNFKYNKINDDNHDESLTCLLDKKDKDNKFSSI